MYFKNFSALLAMGHHGVYVWTAFGITLLALITAHGLNGYRHRRLRHLFEELKREL